MVDPRQLPLARLDDDVDRAALELRQPQLEAELVELLPRDARLERLVVLADPAVPRDEVEAELADVARLDLAHLARHEVVVEELHGRADASKGRVEPSPLTSWTLDPLQLAPLAIVALAYGLRARTLARRGQPVPRRRIVLFATGIALLLLALASPIAVLGEEDLFSVHMLQHVLLGDLAPLCLLAGLTGPLLRPVLAFRVVERLRVLANPLVALPLWAANLFFWHVPALYDGAVRHDLRARASSTPASSPRGSSSGCRCSRRCPRRSGSAPARSSRYIVVVRLVETVLGNVFLWASSPFYAVYVHASRRGASPRREDQGWRER